MNILHAMLKVWNKDLYVHDSKTILLGNLHYQMPSAKGIVFANGIVILKTMLFEDKVAFYGSLDPLGEF